LPDFQDKDIRRHPKPNYVISSACCFISRTCPPVKIRPANQKKQVAGNKSRFGQVV
jgi:hypothetical protein